MKKINGFSLIESLLSLSILLLICTFLFPLMLGMIQQLDKEKDFTLLLQNMHSEIQIYQGVQHQSTTADYKIELKLEEGRRIICGTSQKNQTCISAR
ncbi:ComG operon protein [Listeria floridensis FSL S10-1187]|uniref:ComG operon protein n=1 Tax=Listeria floridensis FSL S10-1187 TaxID=1265817 RepID=A0ABN0RF31_9LIST|nr:hypothetical protein [Listeria floridensis]EUJ31767.1 ComG operon protein [Listeria floridensis FSL S10-1187]